ncbi:MAG: hypothetical protein KDC27_13180 [Acidobacteria bacterium]|nr:hypothetical protein [Acidobacteriota bacterium]
MPRWRASSAKASAAPPFFLALLLSACGASSPPSQARFTVGPCQALPVSGIEDLAWSPAPAPLLEPGPAGSWDSTDALNPSVVRFQGRYLNFYSGFDGRTWRTGLATSADGLAWEKHPGNPLFGPDSRWEGAYIAANGATLVRGSQILHWYQAGPRNQTRIGFGHSADGLVWEKHPANPLFGPDHRWEGSYIGANGATLVRDDQILHWYQSGPRNQTRIGFGHSSDGLEWERAPEPVLGYGPAGSWDESALGDPYAVQCGDWLYLYYLGQNRFGVQRLGVARSRDGVHWQKSHLNPVLDTGGEGAFDERGLGEPAVFFADGAFWMVYVGRDAEERRRLGWARSSDGVEWAKVPRPGIIPGVQPWNQAVVCDPEILLLENRLLILFGGGDRPSPDENLDGRIGVLLPQTPQ